MMASLDALVDLAGITEQVADIDEAQLRSIQSKPSKGLRVNSMTVGWQQRLGPTQSRS